MPDAYELPEIEFMLDEQHQNVQTLEDTMEKMGICHELFFDFCDSWTPDEVYITLTNSCIAADIAIEDAEEMINDKKFELDEVIKGYLLEDMQEHKSLIREYFKAIYKLKCLSNAVLIMSDATVH